MKKVNIILILIITGFLACYFLSINSSEKHLKYSDSSYIKKNIFREDKESTITIEGEKNKDNIILNKNFIKDNLFSYDNPKMTLDERIHKFMMNEGMVAFFNDIDDPKELNSFENYKKGEIIEVFKFDSLAKEKYPIKFIAYYNPDKILSHVVIVRWNGKMYVPDGVFNMLKHGSMVYPVIDSQKAVENLYKRYPNQSFEQIQGYYFNGIGLVVNYMFESFVYDENGSFVKNKYFVDINNGYIVSKTDIDKTSEVRKKNIKKEKFLLDNPPISKNNDGYFSIDESRINLYGNIQDEYRQNVNFMNELIDRGCVVELDPKSIPRCPKLTLSEMKDLNKKMKDEFDKDKINNSNTLVDEKLVNDVIDSIAPIIVK